MRAALGDFVGPWFQLKITSCSMLFARCSVKKEVPVSVINCHFIWMLEVIVKNTKVKNLATGREQMSIFKLRLPLELQAEIHFLRF